MKVLRPVRARWVAVALLAVPMASWAAPVTNGQPLIVHQMANLLLQLGLILFAARLGGILVSRIHLPPVLGELAAGILIGHSLLGGIALPGFPHGLFAAPVGGSLPVTPELYGIATLASIVLLLFAGLETDLQLLLRFSVTGLAVGVGGAVGSFAAGALVGVQLLHASLLDPRCLFLGIISTATSVGITVRILSDRRKMDTPEGVTVIAAAVIDDVLGIILLAVVTGIVVSEVGAAGSSFPLRDIAIVTLEAIGAWLVLSVAGLLAAKKIAAFLKRFGGITAMSVTALAVALLCGAVFEKAGLAMIIGAYMVGLALSTTDLKYALQDALEPLYAFLVPVFFTVTGMLVDIRQLLSPEVLTIGAFYSAAAVLGKLIGCGLPSRFLGFNNLGALRIGLGMAPRGEVALIMAGIGLSYGVLDQSILGICVIMILVTTMIAPLFSAFLTDRPGTTKPVPGGEAVATTFDLGAPELADLLENRIVRFFHDEGSFVHTVPGEVTTYYVRSGSTSITIVRHEQSIVFDTRRDDIPYIKTLVYETLVSLHNVVEKVRHVAKPEELKKEMFEAVGTMRLDMTRILGPACVIMHLEGTTKEEIIRELVDKLDGAGKLIGRAGALAAVMEREQTMSTGMQHGIALPHGKSECVGPLVVSVGLKPEGVEFGSLDGQPSQVFICAISSPTTTGPHIQFLASVGSLFRKAEDKDLLLKCTTPQEVVAFFTGQKK